VIHTIPIPTPFAVGRVNTYLVEDDPLTLVDTGPNSGKALDELEQALAALGHRVEDLGLIVVTHQHMDHLGLVSILARRSGAGVAALDLLAPWMASYAQSMEADDEFSERMMARHGIPEDVRYALRAVSHSFRGWGAAAQVTLALHDGGELALRDRTFRVHHRPGHSPSDTILHDEAAQVLFAGDHLIKHISSNPLLARPLDGASSERPRALMTYLDSLRATRAMERVARVLPGHGEAFGDHVALIDERLRLHERRARKLHGLIAERPRSAYELAQAMWGNVAVTQAYLTLSEVLGHVDLLLADGRAAEEESDGVVTFVSLTPPEQAPPASA
jgi:glyoxylase-like metal-dependent hydrolase (beta-lactamase superfamily II)